MTQTELFAMHFLCVVLSGLFISAAESVLHIGKRMRMFTCRVSNFIMMSKSTCHGVQKFVIGVQCISNVSPFCWVFTRYCTNSENVGQRGLLGVDLFPDPLT
jgi:hypothetical protein